MKALKLRLFNNYSLTTMKIKFERTREDRILNLTKEQRSSYKRICKRYGKTCYAAYNVGEYLICQFKFIMIGIEKDGYAHS